jgi:hypothetical protein
LHSPWRGVGQHSTGHNQHLDNMCEILDNVCDINRDVYFLVDLNNDWLHQEKASNCNQYLQPGSGHQSNYQGS